jgi:AcrR family transcriptional regulator
MVATRIVMARVGVVVALMAAVLGGWLWGASGRWDIDRALRAAELRNEVIEARAEILGARVSLSDGDYHGTIRQLANARRLLGQACGRLDAPATCDDLLPTLDLRGVGAEIDRALRLTAALGRGPRVAAGAQKAVWSIQPVENR